MKLTWSNLILKIVNEFDNLFTNFLFRKFMNFRKLHILRKLASHIINRFSYKTAQFTLSFVHKFLFSKKSHWCVVHGFESRWGKIEYLLHWLSSLKPNSSLNKYSACLLQSNIIPLKGTVAWDGFFFHCILSRIESKDLKFFHVVPIFTELGQDLTHLAHTEKTQSDNFL